jgi:hypothetical protein
MSELDRHVTETAEVHDRDALARPGTPVPQRGVGSDAGAQQRSSGSEVDAPGMLSTKSASTTTWVK